MSDDMTYKAAGVDIEAGYEAVRRIRTLARSTYRPEVLNDIGSFGGFFALDVSKYEEPVLVSGTDGVGTKLKVAFMANRHDTVGIDLVAYCVNDIICQGAKPLFFLDYLATGKVSPDQIEQIVRGIAEGCHRARCALIGGETAEMPGFYAEGEYDLAGFAVGVVDKKHIVDGSAVMAGDKIVAIGSTGLQSSGFSLVRRIVFDTMGLSVDDYVEELEGTVGDVLLTPTAVYADVIMRLIEKTPVHGIANISGGGLPENIPRAIRNDLRPVVRKGSWPIPRIFSFLQRGGGVSPDEMYRTFNMGVGMVVIVPNEAATPTCEIIEACGHPASIIGEIVEATCDDRSLLLLD